MFFLSLLCSGLTLLCPSGNYFALCGKKNSETYIQTPGLSSSRGLDFQGQPNRSKAKPDSYAHLNSWDSVYNQVLDNSTDANTLRLLLYPLAMATKISYTGQINESIEGFYLIKARQPKAGLHILAYRHTNSHKILIAFRGTTSESDRCADCLLWNFKSPPFCDKFSHESLNYVRQAYDFVKQILNKRLSEGKKEVDLLLTGHSLGAALSQILMLMLKSQLGHIKSLSFAPPGVKKVTKRYWLDIFDTSGITAIVIPGDPVVSDTVQLQIGISCKFSEIQPPVCCLKCKNYIKHYVPSISCKKCFNETHLFFHYLDRLEDMTVHPTCFYWE